MQNSFVTTVPSSLPPTENCGDNDFSSITTLLKSPALRDLLRVIVLLFIIVNSTGVYLCISLARYLSGTAGELKSSLPHTLAPLSPAHPRRWGQFYKVTEVPVTDQHHHDMTEKKVVESDANTHFHRRHKYKYVWWYFHTLIHLKLH